MTTHHKIRIMRVVAGLTVTAMAMSSLLRVTPARADSITASQDTMPRASAR